MSEPKSSTDDEYSSTNLSVMAAAAEQRISTAAAAIALADDDSSSDVSSSSPSRRSKLVLPIITPAMELDLALTKLLGTNKSSKPISFSGRPEFADYPLKGIVAPHPNDVLCGRGGGSNNHPGNESFRELVNEVKVPYVNCPKREKPLIARRIVEAVRNQTPPGRFLCKDSKGLWNDIGDGRAREKTSQALREGAPIIRDMIRSPTDPNPSDVAAVVKEAKKARYQQPTRQQEQEREYPVPPLPETPTSIVRTPSHTTPAKRKGHGNDGDVNATAITAEMSYDDEMMDEMIVGGGGGPISPPSSKMKRDAFATTGGGGGGIGYILPSTEGTWGTPQRGNARGAIEEQYDATPQRGSTMSSRKRHGDAASGYQGAQEVTYSTSFGGGEIFPAGSWSPSHMHEVFSEEAELSAFVSSRVSPYRHTPNAARGSPHPESSFAVASSPSQGGITIRGSPILRKSDRGDADGASADLSRSDWHSTPARGDRTPTGHPWQQHSAAGMRVKIGSVGMETNDVRRGIEGINSVLRGSPVSAPKKALGRHEPTMAATRFTYASETASMTGYTPTPTRRGPHNILHLHGMDMMTPATADRRGTGKENADNDNSSRITCTCKNSKCLKLYCVCFAAEQYCYDCKCSDCHNTPQFEAIRSKAIADTVAKNPKAFKEKMSEATHAIGCKCKKSFCLKKYCECFQGGVVCGPKCKCVNCKNYVGSQALIDRRRKIKDHKGAETAMMSAEQAWKGNTPDMTHGGPIVWAQSPIVHEPLRGMSSGSMTTSPLVAFGSNPHHPGYNPSQYPNSTGMIQQSPMMYRGMGPPHPIYSVPMAKGASRHQPHQQPWSAPQKPSQSYTATSSNPRTPSFQRRLDDVRSKENSESKKPYFGPDVPDQTKTTALTVFSYLTNDDLFNASIVSKRWCDVSFDQALWTTAL